MAARISKQAVKKYRDFHGHLPMKAVSYNLPDLQNLVFLGDDLRISYRSNKMAGGGDGRMTEFRHKCAKTTKLFCSQDGKCLVILGPSLHVNDRGIVN